HELPGIVLCLLIRAMMPSPRHRCFRWGCPPTAASSAASSPGGATSVGATSVGTMPLGASDASSA
ncbi:unnamed protein product, partial [Closterium sp. NIES-53]